MASSASFCFVENLETPRFQSPRQPGPGFAPSLEGSGATSHCSCLMAESGLARSPTVGEPEPDHRRLAAAEQVRHVRAELELEGSLRDDLVLVDEVEDLLHPVDAGGALVHHHVQLVVHQVPAVAPEVLHPADDPALALVQLHGEAGHVGRLQRLRRVEQLVVRLRRLQPLGVEEVLAVVEAGAVVEPGDAPELALVGRAVAAFPGRTSPARPWAGSRRPGSSSRRRRTPARTARPSRRCRRWSPWRPRRSRTCRAGRSCSRPAPGSRSGGSCSPC